jgi:hypothetical protein
MDDKVIRQIIIGMFAEAAFKEEEQFTLENSKKAVKFADEVMELLKHKNK